MSPFRRVRFFVAAPFEIHPARMPASFTLRTSEAFLIQNQRTSPLVPSAPRLPSNAVPADSSLCIAASVFQTQDEIYTDNDTTPPRAAAEFTQSRTEPREFCGYWLARPAGPRFLFVDPQFFSTPSPTIGHLQLVALRFLCRGQLTGGLPPPRLRSCRTHKKRVRIHPDSFLFTPVGLRLIF